MKHHDNHNQLKYFIQDGLGCGCPEEVFESIEIFSETSVTLTGCPLVSVLVGQRLLIHFLLINNTDGISKEVITQLADKGRIKRDNNDYNRFRLVLAADDPTTLPALISIMEFDRLKADERIHLHICSKKEIPAFLLDY